MAHLTNQEIIQDTSKGPVIHRKTIPLLLCDLWSEIVHGSNAVPGILPCPIKSKIGKRLCGVVIEVVRKRNEVGVGEVGDADILTIWTEQNVLWLNIAVDDSHAMKSIYTKCLRELK